MTEAQIKLKRTEALLAELIPEALTQLNDARLHELSVIEVKCSRGRSDAKVFWIQAVLVKKRKMYISNNSEKHVLSLRIFALRIKGGIDVQNLPLNSMSS